MHFEKTTLTNSWRNARALIHVLLGAIITVSLTTPFHLSADVSTSQLPVLTGTDVVTLDSESVGDTFVLYIRVPPEAAAEPDRKFPVIYAMDGDHTFPLMASAITQVGWSGAVPPAIIVGVGYGTLDLENGNHRSRDLSPRALKRAPNSGGGPEFLTFLKTEVMPHIESNYPADSEKRYLFGHSLGGLFALYAYMTTPETFSGIIAGSPFIGGQIDYLEELASSSEPRTCKLFIVTGDEEDPVFFIDDLEPLRTILANGIAAPDSFEIVLIPNFDHFTMVAPSISLGLKSIFSESVDK